MEEVKVIIADSNQLIRFGLSAILRNYDGLAIVGEATNEAELQEMISNFHPDVVMIDFLADGFSVDTVNRCKQGPRAPKIVAITSEQSGHTIVNALKAGVDSYIKKDCDINEIVDSVKETGAGGKFFCGQILDAIAKESIDVHDLNLLQVSCGVSLSYGCSRKACRQFAC